MIRKVFDKNGTEVVRFAKDATEQIQKWLDQSGVSLEEAMKYAKEVDDRVFGKALEFPCIILEN